MKFLSTLSLRRATGGYGCAYLYLIISIHALLAESDGMTEFIGALFDISIHALLAESDAWCMSRKTPVQAAFLSTLSLRRATLPETAAVVPSRQFLSTLSLRRATPRTKSTISRRPYFYPRSPCGERLRARAAEGQRPEISIHALLAESDILGNPCAGCPAISIHALLAVALRKESVDRNSMSPIDVLAVSASLSARRAWIEISMLCSVVKC